MQGWSCVPSDSGFVLIRWKETFLKRVTCPQPFKLVDKCSLNFPWTSGYSLRDKKCGTKCNTPHILQSMYGEVVIIQPLFPSTQSENNAWNVLLPRNARRLNETPCGKVRALPSQVAPLSPSTPPELSYRDTPSDTLGTHENGRLSSLR